MKFLILGDLHLLWDNPKARLDDLNKTQVEKLLYVLDWARRNNVTAVFQPGDFFDHSRSWYLLPEVARLLFLNCFDFESFRQVVRIFAVFGQHDTYMYSVRTRSNTSLGVLASSGLVELLSENSVCLTEGPEAVFVYGCNYGQEVPKPRDDFTYNILVIHAPIAREALFPGHEHESMTTFLRKNTSYELIICGDIHRKFEYSVGGRYILNAGPMLRKTAELYSFEHKPGFYVYDTSDDSVSWHEIPHKPAEEVLTREHIELQKETKEMFDGFMELVDGDFEPDIDFVENVWAFVKENKIPQDVVDTLSETYDVVVRE